MRVKILFFGMLKDLVGRSVEESEIPDGANLSSLFEGYAERYPELRRVAGSVVLARNQEFADRATMLRDGDEIAFLPPVSGGTSQPLEISQDGHYFALTRNNINSRSVVDHLLTGGEGAVVTFEGTVRNHTKGRPTLYLDYECYEPMAIRMMAKIGAEIACTHDVERVAMVHRLGRLLIGEASVVVIVSAAHRRAAFEAAFEGINRLKKLVPIWKKEYFADGEVWVEGEWDRNVPVAG